MAKNITTDPKKKGRRMTQVVHRGHVDHHNLFKELKPMKYEFIKDPRYDKIYQGLNE